MSKATGTYPAYVSTSPPPSAPAPSASAPQQAVINSQGQNLPPSSDQFQARLCACAPAPLEDLLLSGQTLVLTGGLRRAACVHHGRTR